MMRLMACFLSFHCAVLGAELAVLANGFSLRVDRHEQQGQDFVLYTAQGVTRLAVRDVLEFEAIATPPVAVVPPVPVAEVKRPPATPVQMKATRGASAGGFLYCARYYFKPRRSSSGAMSGA